MLTITRLTVARGCQPMKFQILNLWPAEDLKKEKNKWLIFKMPPSVQ